MRLQHPCCTVIPTLVLSMKRCIGYTSQGFCVGHTLDPVKLPTHITSVYSDWKTSLSALFYFFVNMPMILQRPVSMMEPRKVSLISPIHKSAPNTCHERTEYKTADRVLSVQHINRWRHQEEAMKNTTENYWQILTGHDQPTLQKRGRKMRTSR